jgi:monofunctional biosynthetic peptidoglycan transglycosylase
MKKPPLFIRLQYLLWRCWKIPFAPLWLFLLWFIPWVWTFYLGFLFYFPYHPHGEGRFLKVTGPVLSPWISPWSSSKEIPKSCQSALVASEDGRFFDHYGLDWDSLKENYFYNKRFNRIRRGGSTITQQLVKNAFLSRERTYLRKSREIVGAIILDLIMSKQFQLVWYFNIIEFGPNIYGIEEAAQFYFRKKASQLNRRECLLLVSIIPSPNRWNKGLQKKSLTPFLLSRSQKIFHRLKKMGLSF